MGKNTLWRERHENPLQPLQKWEREREREREKERREREEFLLCVYIIYKTSYSGISTMDTLTFCNNCEAFVKTSINTDEVSLDLIKVH